MSVKSKIHGVKLEIHGVKIENHDVKIEVHGVKLENHSVKLEIHGVKLEVHGDASRIRSCNAPITTPAATSATSTHSRVASSTLGSSASSCIG